MSINPALKWIGGGGALLVLLAIVASSEAEAMPTPRPTPPPPPRGGGSVARLQAKLNAAGVKHFGAHELLKIRWPAIAKRVGITSPQFETRNEEILDNLVEVAKIADRLRERYGAPITVLNGYRPRAYNDEVSDSKESQHIYGRALDLTADDMPRLRAIASEMFEAGEFNGFGSYLGNIHMDTRGRPYSWGSQLPD